MYQLMEITGVVNEKGSIEIPAALLAQTGIHTEEKVRLIYLTAENEDHRNESKEFLLTRVGENPVEGLLSEENVELKIPPELLKDANIPLHSDLDIVCVDRKIVILPSEDVDSDEVPEEILVICEELGIPKEKVNIILRVAEDEHEKAGL